MSQLAEHVLELGRRARAASRRLATIARDRKDSALLALADALVDGEGAILDANARDLVAAKLKGLSAAMIDRLSLDTAHLAAMAQQVRCRGAAGSRR